MIRLEPVSLQPPQALMDLLIDLGDGENGFGGNPVHNGHVTLDEYLCKCCDERDPAKVRPGLVPQTVFWVLDAASKATGIVRLRHFLNDNLLIHGGHIGYYIRSDRRGRGYGKQMLGLALEELRKLGEKRALITTDLDNLASIAVITMNGGYLSDVGAAPKTGAQFGRYWIDL